MKATTAISKLVRMNERANDIEYNDHPVFSMRHINSGPEGWAEADAMKEECYKKKEKLLGEIAEDISKMKEKFPQDVWDRILAETESVLGNRINSFILFN